MITYTVKYKKIGSFFWNKLKKVKGDGILFEFFDGGSNTWFNSRWFILEDETRVEISMKNVIFKFSKERHFSIQERMSNETGQQVRTEKR